MLHLHCKGIAEVTNLEEYTGLKAVYLVRRCRLNR